MGRAGETHTWCMKNLSGHSARITSVGPRLFPCLWLLGLALIASGAEPSATKRTFMVSMRDGVKLATDVYLPSTNGAFPVLLARTPYSKAVSAGAGEDGARHGYATVVQDTRGRFASEGDNLAFEADGWAEKWDGYD